MPALHIYDFINQLNQTKKSLKPLELKLSSFTSLEFALYQAATQSEGPLITLFDSQESLDQCFLFAQSLQKSTQNEDRLALCSWPAWEHSPFSPIASSLTQRIDRLKTLSLISLYKKNKNNKKLWVFMNATSWLQPTLPCSVFEQNQIHLTVGGSIDSREKLQESLKNLGYQKSNLVEEPGQFAIRGEIVDIYVPSFRQPFRIELFDTEIEKIRSFHPETQRTETPLLNEFTIYPAEEVLFPWQNPEPVLEKIKNFCDEHHLSRKIRDPIFENIKQGFLPENFRTWLPFVYPNIERIQDHLPQDAKFVIIEPENLKIKLKEEVDSIKKEETRYENPHWIAPTESLLYPGAIESLSLPLQKSSLVARALPLDESAAVTIQCEPVEKISKQEIEEALEDGFSFFIGSKSISHQERIKHFLGELQHHSKIKILSVNPSTSFQFLVDRTFILSESIILGHASSHKNKTPPPSTYSQSKNTGLEFQNVQDLAVGDFVVHSLHGVGKYLGFSTLTSQEKSLGEYLLIEYSQGDKLYLPVYRLNVIQKFVGAGGHPALDRLGQHQFEKTKQKARESAKKLAVNLLEIYAKKALLKGPKFDLQNEQYDDFCDQFQFTETEGQLKAIEDVLFDLENGKLLDRLVCGDVGFGKTEVAMRAAFQAVQSGYQVAVLVPTTLLAFQHEQTFKARMKNFALRIESLSRFKSKKLQTSILKEASENKIDILIGTHRLLSKDVHFSKLGLLVIDEEHRFGVDHKEKIMALQANTHTLTLTATPIPRTLNMALSGIKDISLIRTPPTNRQPIKTYVSSYSDELVKSAIENELARGGQVFYLYNLVQSIEKCAKEIQALVPHAKIITAHGQMSEDEIEARMLEFYQGHVQVLVCTTIIESGIDIPNAGTIIIHRADKLGLAQLYQIRGRVGRSHRKASAYLLVDEERVLTQEAKLRLDAIQRFVELGSGFQIASQDLEIRGGGNFLGPEQSGHIAHVGLDLFTELLEEAIQELRGQKIDVEERHFEPEIKAPVLCEIPSTLVSDSQLRLSLYRKLSRAQNDAAVDALYEEFLDRFGKLPVETENLFWLIRLKNLLKTTGIESVVITTEKTVITARKISFIEPAEVMKLYVGPKTIRDPRITLTPDSKIIFEHLFDNLQRHGYELEVLFKKIAPKAFEKQKSH